jgi:BASS family bile acid:Na+ symporter
MLRPLAYLGRHGTFFLAGGLFIGLLLPPLAALLHPALRLFVFLLMVTTFLSVDWSELARHARRPGLLALVLAWCLVGVPVVTALAARLFALPAALAESLVLWAASPPLNAMAAIALLLGLDAALALLATVGGVLLMPLTLPPLVLGLMGIELAIGIAPLMENLALFIGGAALAAALVRALAGAEPLARQRLALSGLNVALLLLFAIAVMDGVGALLLERPQLVLLYAAAALGASLGLQALSFLVFGWQRERIAALTIALIGGNKNMAVVLANLGGATTPELSLFFAAVQLPMYVLPALLRPVYRRLGAARPLAAD